MSVAFFVSNPLPTGTAPARRGPRDAGVGGVRDCRARVTVTCEQVTTDSDAVCAACAEQLDALLLDGALPGDDAPF